MSFILENFTLDRGSLASFKSLNSNKGANSVAIHTYKSSDDSRADIAVAGYFDQLLTEYPSIILEKDFIAVYGSDEPGMAAINGVSPSITIAYTSSQLPAGSVNTEDLAPLAVTNEKVQNNNINASQKLLDASITTSKYEPLSVTGNIIDNATITGSTKLIDASIPQSKLDALSVGTAQLQEPSVTTAKITNLNVTEGKLETAVQNKINITKFVESAIVPVGGVLSVPGVTASDKAFIQITDFGTDLNPAVIANCGVDTITLVGSVGAFNGSMVVNYKVCKVYP